MHGRGHVVGEDNARRADDGGRHRHGDAPLCHEVRLGQDPVAVAQYGRVDDDLAHRAGHAEGRSLVEVCANGKNRRLVDTGKGLCNHRDVVHPPSRYAVRGVGVCTRLHAVYPGIGIAAGVEIPIVEKASHCTAYPSVRQVHRSCPVYR